MDIPTSEKERRILGRLLPEGRGTLLPFSAADGNVRVGQNRSFLRHRKLYLP